jgi:hypothetical protein
MRMDDCRAQAVDLLKIAQEHLRTDIEEIMLRVAALHGALRYLDAALAVLESGDRNQETEIR